MFFFVRVCNGPYQGRDLVFIYARECKSLAGSPRGDFPDECPYFDFRLLHARI